MNLLMAKIQKSNLPDCNGFHNMPSPSSRSDDDQEMAFHTLHKQNAAKKMI